MKELSQIVRELVRITTGYYPAKNEPLEDTLKRLKEYGPKVWDA